MVKRYKDSGEDTVKIYRVEEWMKESGKRAEQRAEGGVRRRNADLYAFEDSSQCQAGERNLP